MRIVIVRGPLALLAMVGIVWVSIVTIDDRSDRRAHHARVFSDIEARGAPLRAAQVGYAQVELWRREGRLTSDVGELGDVGQLLEGRDVSLDVVAQGYTVRVDDFTLSVDYGTGRVETTCSAPERHGCAGGRWSFVDAAGFEPRLLLP